MNDSNKILLSPKLQKGDLVRLVSPASYPALSHVDNYINCLQSWGLRCDIGDHALSQFGYMAGTDTQRLKDLNNAFRDPEVRAILTTRGGAGAYRIADDIDFTAVRADPKPLIGFSDITSLHLSLLHNCRLGGIHGCIAGQHTQHSVKQLLMSTDPILLQRSDNTVSASVNFPGTGHGHLIGGNLQGLANSVGVRMPSMQGAILFLEHHRIGGLGIVDRCLTQLFRSGALEGIAGIVLGSFEALCDHVDRGWQIIDLLNDRFKDLNIPVLGGIFAGHDLTDNNGNPDQFAIPLGSYAEMDVEQGTLKVHAIVR